MPLTAPYVACLFWGVDFGPVTAGGRPRFDSVSQFKPVGGLSFISDLQCCKLGQHICRSDPGAVVVADVDSPFRLQILAA